MRSAIEVYSAMAKTFPVWSAEEEREFIATCVKDGKWISSVNTIEPSANLVGTMKGDSHFLRADLKSLTGSLEKTIPAVFEFIRLMTSSLILG